MPVLGPGLVAAAACCVAGFCLRRLSLRRDILSDPARLRYYNVRRPLFGGLAVAVGFWAGILYFIVACENPWVDKVYSESSVKALLASLLLGSGFLALSTSFADWRQDTGYHEWLYLLGSAAFISIYHLAIEKLSVPFFGSVDVGALPGAVLTIVWVGIVVSVVEVLESLGGVVTLAPIILVSLWFAFKSPAGETVQPLIAVTLVGSLIGIIPCQRVKDGIVLGKAGNKTVGFLFAALTLVGRRKAGTALLILPIGICILYVVLDRLTRMEKRSRTAE